MALCDLNPTGRFTDRAADYVRYRPTYPPGAIDAMLEGLGDPRGVTAADVGAGTGISSRLLSERGVRVIAVEPNLAMREAGRARATGAGSLEWRDGTAEATGLGDGSVDLVACAQSFHWFRADEALREFHRVLRPGGRLALMWNHRDASDAFTAGYRAAILEVGGDSEAERMAFDPAIVARSGLFEAPVLREFRHEQRLDLEGLLGRARSASYVPKEGAGAAALAKSLRALWEAHRDAAGLVRLVYATRVHAARRA